MTAIWRARTASDRSEQGRPELTLVRRRRQRRSMLTRLGTVMLFALFLSVLGVVVFQTLRVQNQAKLDDINARIAHEQDVAKELRLKLADAQAPARIADAARTRLGMIPPNDIAYLQPRPDDDTKAAWDPMKDPKPAPPTTPVPTTTVPTPPPVSTPAPRSPVAGANTSGSTKSTTKSTTKGTTKSTTKSASSGVPAKGTPASTPPTTKVSTPTTKVASTPTTAQRPGTRR